MKIVIAGRTRCGKNLLASRLAEARNLTILKTSTSRPRRTPDEDGYHFYTPEEAAAIPAEKKLYLTTGLDGFERWTDPTDLLAADIAILDFFGVASAVAFWQSHGYDVMVIYVGASREDRMAASVREAVAAGKTREQAVADFEHRDSTETGMFDSVEKAFADQDARDAADALLYPNATPKVHRFFGEDELCRWDNAFDLRDLDEAVAAICRRLPETGNGPQAGYRKFRCREKMVLEPRDWTEAEWRTICRLTGLDPAVTARVSMHPPFVECYIEPDGARNEYKTD